MMLARAPGIWRFGDRRSMSKLVHSQGWQVGAGSQKEVSIPLHMDLSKGQLEYPHNMEAGFPRSGCSKREQSRSCKDFYDLAIGVIHHNFCRIYCSRRPNLILWGRGLHKGVDTRNWESLKAIFLEGWLPHMGKRLHQEKEPRILCTVSLREEQSWPC